MGVHRFFHIDRQKALAEGQEITLDDRKLSRFGAVYWDAIHAKRFDEMSHAEQRERLLEDFHNESRFSVYTSRMQAFFGVNTLDDARRFAEKIEPKPDYKVPVFEVFASTFWTLDMNWLDYNTTDHETRLTYCRNYWYAAISNHNPEAGERKPPHLEVLMALPVRIGKIVEWV